MTLAADPGSLQGAVAAGILGCGPVLLGTAEECARLLEAAQRQVAAGVEPSGSSSSPTRATSAGPTSSSHAASATVPPQPGAGRSR